MCRSARVGINSVFLEIANSNELTSAITNPLEAEVKQAIMAVDVLMGNDENCMNWILTIRKLTAPGNGSNRSSRQDHRRSLAY